MSIFCCTFVAEFDTGQMHLSHSEYYIDRRSERDLCSDFPGDEILIAGLHTMQTHFWNNNIRIDIPVVSVMNAAHYLVAYMMATSCSGDQSEYDVLAYMSVGHDKLMYLLTMVVLAAMLKRTDGFRARNCRNVILENRTEDFAEGVTLYERFLSSAEHHFTEEDFLIDVPTLVAQNTRLEYENSQLKIQLKTMSEDKQKGGTIVYNYGVYNDIHDNPNSTIYTAEQTKEKAAPQDKEYCIYICREKLLEQGIYTLDEFEQMLANAAKEPAMQFAKFLVRYRQQGLLNFMEHTKKQIFDNLRAHFPEMRDYDYPNFAAAY